MSTVVVAESMSMHRINVSIDQESYDWLTAQHDEDRINMSERIRALVVLARTDSAVAGRAVKTADELRRSKRGGSST